MRSKHIIGVVLPLGEPDWPSDKDDALTCMVLVSHVT